MPLVFRCAGLSVARCGGNQSNGWPVPPFERAAIQSWPIRLADIGVSLFGFRLSYASAALALAVGGILAEAVMRFLVARTTRSADGFQLPVLGPLIWPLHLMLNTLLPAFIVNELASRRHSEPELPAQLPYQGPSPLD